MGNNAITFEQKVFFNQQVLNVCTYIPFLSVEPSDAATRVQCSPQAVLAYRADIPYVRKRYRSIHLGACTALAQRAAN